MLGVIIDFTQRVLRPEQPKNPDLPPKPTRVLVWHNFVNEHPGGTERKPAALSLCYNEHIYRTTSEKETPVSASQAVFSLLCHCYTVI